MLRSGSTGSKVRQLQENLRFLGFATGPVDGQFGPQTLEGVKTYQRVRGLVLDGVVGPATWGKLTGEVKWVQTRLNVLGYNAGDVDGLAGPRTKFATVRFQKDYALVPDGIAGSHTRAELENPTRPTQPQIVPPHIEIPPGLVIVPRSEWGARPPKLVTPTARKSLQVTHHTDTAQGPDEAAICRSMQTYHMDTRMWNDIAYSYMVGASGKVYEGRGLLAVGAHTKGWNTLSIGVAVIGTYDSIKPSQATLVSLRRLNEWAASRLGNPLPVVGHRDKNATSCPGDRLYAMMPR